MARRRRTKPKRSKQNHLLAWAVVAATLVSGAMGVWYLQRHPNLIQIESEPIPDRAPAAGMATSPRTTSHRTNLAKHSPSNQVVSLPLGPRLIQPAPQPTSDVSSVISPLVKPSSGRLVKDILEAQVALACLGISSGSIDGVLGSQTRAALRVFQAKEKLPVTGRLDEETQQRLTLSESLYSTYTVSDSDISLLGPVPHSWLGKSQLDRLGYETLIELAAEKSRAHPDLLQRLNPGTSWTSLKPGAKIKILNMASNAPPGKAAYVQIALAEKCLEVFDSQTNMLAHFPCSIARRAEKRPVGRLAIKSVVPNPHYVFDPAIFPESAEGRALGRKLVLPPGPNSPVGTVWIGLDRPGYGIHGTPHPEDVGRTESHGCFRLANWNAELLMQMVDIGTPVFVKPSMYSALRNSR